MSDDTRKGRRKEARALIGALLRYEVGSKKVNIPFIGDVLLEYVTDLERENAELRAALDLETEEFDSE